MRAYKIITYITAVTTLFFAFLSTMFHYHGAVLNIDAEYWSSFCLSVFGSSLLTFLSSVLIYRFEREKTLKHFLYLTKQILTYLGLYRYNMTIDEKKDFFDGFLKLDKTTWKNEYYNLSFFFGPITKDRARKYIFDNIVSPIEQFNIEVVKRIFVFRPERAGSDIYFEEEYVQKKIAELQDYLVEHKEGDIAVEFDDEGKPVRWKHYISESAKLMADVSRDLEGRYREILYGKNRKRNREEF